TGRRNHLPLLSIASGAPSTTLSAGCVTRYDVSTRELLKLAMRSGTMTSIAAKTYLLPWAKESSCVDRVRRLVHTRRPAASCSFVKGKTATMKMRAMKS
ncbi:hypothetical protein F444_19772, partial [Phytophthora nicotianae P1976]